MHWEWGAADCKARGHAHTEKARKHTQHCAQRTVRICCAYYLPAQVCVVILHILRRRCDAAHNVFERGRGMIAVKLQRLIRSL